MGGKTNPKLIGAFLLGALLLVIAALLVFGSRQFTSSGSRWVMFFDGSVKGLSVGAPVVFKGVRIGTVADIQLIANPEALTLEIPVIINIEADKFKLTSDKAHFGDTDHDRREITARLVSRGLRAQLVLQSLVTGQLMIELDFHPDTPIHLKGYEPEMIEIPTIQSGLVKLTKEIGDIPLAEMANKLTSAITGIERKINTVDIEETITLLNQLLVRADALVEHLTRWTAALEPDVAETLAETRRVAGSLNSGLATVVPETRSTLAEIQATARQASQSLSRLDDELAPMAADARQTLEGARQAMERIEPLLANLQEMTAPHRTLRHDLQSALKEIAAAGRALRLLSETLERHPEALLKGKPDVKGDR